MTLVLVIYRETFKQNAIDWDVLPDLSDGDLEAMGVLLGHRKKLLRAIASLSQSAETMGRGSIPISAFQAGSHSTQNRIKQNVAS